MAKQKGKKKVRSNNSEVKRLNHILQSSRAYVEDMTNKFITVSKELYLIDPTHPLFDPTSEDHLDEVFINHLEQVIQNEEKD